jgi:hypothetical protein
MTTSTSSTNNLHHQVRDGLVNKIIDMNNVLKIPTTTTSTGTSSDEQQQQQQNDIQSYLKKTFNYM